MNINIKMAIKLVYDKYQNETGFIYGENEGNHQHTIINFYKNLIIVC